MEDGISKKVSISGQVFMLLLSAEIGDRFYTGKRSIRF